MVRPPRPLTALSRRFTSPLRSTRLTAHLGLWLAAAFGVCFATGLLSHAIQHPPGWFHWPARPVQLYRITQGLHVATGLACLPLLTAKIWSVYPRLFAWPPVRNLPHALERAAAALLSAAVFELVTGVLNIAYWYAAMPFGFLGAHYWTAWLLAGALLLHLAAKLPLVRRQPDPQVPPEPGRWTRRGVLALAGSAAGVVTVATAGQTVRPLHHLSVLAPRVPGIGPQGLPVNKTASSAGVARVDERYRLIVTGPDRRHALSLADLVALPQVTADLPISCVEGWSAGARWQGVRVADLLRLVGAAGLDRPVTVESLQPSGPYRTSVLEPAVARDQLTLLALRIGGEPLHLDHGYPCRLIAPNRPGVLQTKWVAALTVSAR
ncbi:molybdopterin-dependent oxidoreductase [Dactylosporangium sp. AC04546]|uniref:molybdopterin-dependent oxidoreductase n=1 Tax=Dactylosporangium sp. AC04546 TaxID=2862460 RepID=UPI0027152E85|nr:molybdopterin-dependent oxidoreductase [Dactylosporangium sp. AC04546]WVK80810.1 molybdopterin-dependent oxidoreductase [Dactylosporangium sp. AC04546]